MKFSVRTKLMVMFSTLLLMIIVVISTNLYLSSRTQKRFQTILNKDTVSVNTTTHLLGITNFVHSKCLLHIFQRSMDEMDQYESEIAGWVVKIRSEFDSLQNSIKDKEILDEVAGCRMSFERYIKIWNEELKPLSRANHDEQAFALARGKGPAGSAIQKTIYNLNKLHDEIVEKVADKVESAERDSKKNRMISLAIILVAIIFSLFFSIRFGLRIAGRVNTVAKAAQRVAAGDLDQKVEAKTGDEIESLADSFNTMSGSLKKMVEKLQHEITGRHRTEEELEKHRDHLEELVKERTQTIKTSEEKYRLHFENVTDVIWAMDMNLRFIDISPSVTLMRGYSVKEAMAQTLEEFLTPASLEVAMKIFAEQMAIEEMEQKKDLFKSWTLELEQYCKDGSTIWSESKITGLRDPDGRLYGILGITRNITERKQAEEMLRSERNKFQGIIAALGEGMYIINLDHIVEYQNDIFKKRFGDTTGKKCYKAYMGTDRPCEVCSISEVIKTGETQHVELIATDGRNYDISSSSFIDMDGIVKMIHLAKDVTAKKLLEAEAMRTGHLASIGELAAGVAHEINNPINGIINYAQILKDECHEQSQNGIRCDDEIPIRIIKEGNRIAGIVKNLLSFARDQKDEHSPAHVRDIFSDTLGLIKTQIIKDGIKISVDFPSNLPRVKVRSQEIQQVFLNILSNAQYALNEKFPGSHEDKLLEINGEIREIKGQKYVRTIFYDQGVGIPENILNKICDPFFSTKPDGEGTGLGLNISRNIIKNHGGKLQFESVEGKHTSVMVDLPANNDWTL